jgi:putative transposase
MTKTKRKPRRKPKSKPLGTIWEIPDAMWERILPILLKFWPKKPTGRRTANWRAALNGIIFRMRTGCQWEQLPRKFGPKSTVHDWFQRWCAGGVMQQIWAVLVAECDEVGAVDWRWQSAGGGQARLGEKTGKSHGPRQDGHQVRAGDGGGVGAVIAGANVGARMPPDDRGHGRAARADGGGAANCRWMGLR